MKKYQIYAILSAACFVLGISVFLIKRSWLIIHWAPSYRRSEDVSGFLNKKVAPRKNVFLYFWKDGRLKKESASFVWLASKAEIVKLLVGNWLTFVYEERILEKRVGVESVALSETEQDAYVSFDQLPFLREWSIHKKSLLLDGLLKTLDHSGLGVQKLFFLVNHEPMLDDHLDFSQPWPVSGFG